MRKLVFALLATTFLAACGEKSSEIPEPPVASEPSAAPELPVQEPAVVAPAQDKPWHLVHSQGVMNFVHMDEKSWMDQDQYRLAIGEICSGKNICQVLFWKDRSMVPSSLPMSDAQVSAKVAHWQYNGNTGHRQLLWSCKIVNDPSECFSN